jgi:peptidoglycan/xylan/chitin deacetylase (PgdA/CDA1 family)
MRILFLKKCLSILLLAGAIILCIYIYSQQRKTQSCIRQFEESSLLTREQPNYLAIPVQTASESAIQIPILMYHTVNNDHENDITWIDMTTSADVFKQQLELLQLFQYKTITLDDVYDILQKNVEPENNIIVLTFDDGYSDFYTTVYPLLQKFNMKATVFVPINFIGKQNYLNWKQIEEMNKTKLVSFESHSYHHYPMTCLSPIETLFELIASKVILQLHVNNPIHWFSYPYGLFNTTHFSLLKISGYSGAVTTIGGNQQSLNKIYSLTRDQGKMNSVSNLYSILNQSH